jgi:repressor LexA
MKGVHQMEKMTRKEQVIYDFVVLYRAKMHFSPSMREIAEGVGLYSVSTVHKHVHSLVGKGWFLPYAGKNRTILPNEELLVGRA